MAEAELHLALADNGQNAEAHRLLATCLLEREQFDPAEAEARMAIHLAPDEASPHLTLAWVLYTRRRDGEARRAVEEAIRLDANQVHAFGLLAWIWFRAENWQAALQAADQGLAIDPEDSDSTNVRAMALVKLGRRKEAGRTIDAALARDPEDAATHANQGWTLLEAGSRAKAMEHFREALRLDPNQEWARAGIVEGLKSKNFVYRWLLRYFLWMSRLGGRKQWFIIIGLFVLIRILSGLSKSTPAIAPFVEPIIVLYSLFALLTWLGSPLFNLLLILDKSGRYALSGDERKGTLIVVGILVAAVAFVVLGFLLQSGQVMTAAVNTALFSIPASAIYRGCSAGWPRQTLAAVTVVIGAIGWVPLFDYLAQANIQDNPAVQVRESLRRGFVHPVLIGSQFAAVALSRVNPRR